MTEKYTIELNEAEKQALKLVLHNGLTSTMSTLVKAMIEISGDQEKSRFLGELSIAIDSAIGKYLLAIGEDISEERQMAIAMAEKIDHESLVSKATGFLEELDDEA